MRVLKTAIADCETIAFPAKPKKGTRCFRVDKGKLFEFNGEVWEQIPVPIGKLWFDPKALKMKRRTKSGWVGLDAYLKVENARRRKAERAEEGVQAVGRHAAPKA